MRRGETTVGSPEWEVQMEKEIYEAPQLRELGEVHALTEGATGDAADGFHLLVTPPPIGSPI